MSLVLRTPTGKIKDGMTWDQALPMLQSGERLKDPQWPSPNRFIETRKWTGTYEIVFERPALPKLGPYRVVSIVAVKTTRPTSSSATSAEPSDPKTPGG